MGAKKLRAPPSSLSKFRPRAQTQSKISSMSSRRHLSQNLKNLIFRGQESNDDSQLQNSKPHTWLDDLPPVIKPDETIHQILLKKRLHDMHMRHLKICKQEFESMLTVSFQYRSNQFKQTKLDYINGKILYVKKVVKKREFTTVLMPMLELNSREFLSRLTSPKMEDLNVFFNVDDIRISSANPDFNTFLAKIRRDADMFIKEFTLRKESFSGIICVVGPPGGGLTTIVQLLQHCLNFELIDILSDTDPSKKTPVVEEKNIPNHIVQFIAGSKSPGFVICGYPNNKNQLTALEKVLGTKGDKKPSKGKTTPSPSKKNVLFEVDVQLKAFIFALNHCEKVHRFIDPVTECVYCEDFLMPSFPDLVGLSPIDFKKKIEEIYDRLHTEEVPDSNPKLIDVYRKFEISIKKSYYTLVVNKTDLKTLTHSLDQFLLKFFKINGNIISSSFAPDYLIDPGIAYQALSTWEACLQKFGPKLGSQQKLLDSLADNIPKIISHTKDRFNLWFIRKDFRARLVEESVENQDASNFNEIWDLTHEIEHEMIQSVPTVLQKSGLMEVIQKVEECEQAVLYGLVEKFLYVNWFINETKNQKCQENFFEEFGFEISQVPDYASSIFERPGIKGSRSFHMRRRAKSIDVRRGKSIRVSDTLKITMDLDGKQHKISGPMIDFNEVCSILNIPQLQLQKTNVDDMAKAIFNHLSFHSLKSEADMARTFFNKFVTHVNKKEKYLMDSYSKLNQDLINMAKVRCRFEMEYLSAHFRQFRKGVPLPQNLCFKYDVSMLSSEVKPLADYLLTFDDFIIQKFFPFSKVHQLATMVNESGHKYMTMTDLEDLAKFVFEGDEMNLFKICVIVICAQDLIDVPTFLSLFASTPEEMIEMDDLFITSMISGNQSIHFIK